MNFKHFSYEQYITPNVLLTITKEQKSNKYKLIFTQKHFYLYFNVTVTGCQLIFYLEYDDNMKNINFIEDTYENNHFDKKKIKIIKGQKSLYMKNKEHMTATRSSV